MNNIVATILVIAILATAFCFLTHATSSHQLAIGNKAPDFSLPNENGTIVTLSQQRGKKVALYFYPKDNTPGCTTQACSIRDDYDQLQKEGITIFGLSPDKQKSHTAFKKKHNLPFSILSTDKHTLNAYGVNGWLFISRKTFLINEEGIIVAIIEKIDTANHAQQIIRAFKK